MHLKTGVRCTDIMAKALSHRGSTVPLLCHFRKVAQKWHDATRADLKPSWISETKSESVTMIFRCLLSFSDDFYETVGIRKL